MPQRNLWFFYLLFNTIAGKIYVNYTGYGDDLMYLILDELGTHDCRYLVIAGMCVEDPKPVKNKVKKISHKIKKRYPSLVKEKEIKSAEISIKRMFVDGLTAVEDIEFRYVVADKEWIYESLKQNQNILINYLMGFLIKPLVHKLDSTGAGLHILFDNRSLKTGAKFCMEEYLQTKSYGDWRCSTPIDVQYLESSDNYVIQGAHYVANAIWMRYEHDNLPLYKLMTPKIACSEQFPRRDFGKSIIPKRSAM